MTRCFVLPQSRRLGIALLAACVTTLTLASEEPAAALCDGSSASAGQASITAPAIKERLRQTGMRGSERNTNARSAIHLSAQKDTRTGKPTKADASDAATDR